MSEEKTTTPTTTAPEATEAPAAKPKARKTKRSIPHGQVHIYASFNNTIITITDLSGGALAATSSGACGFRGSKKGTAYAAGIAVEKVANEAKQSFGLRKVDVFVKGIGQGRDAAIRALIAEDIVLESITDKTGSPHGGVRPKKARRV